MDIVDNLQTPKSEKKRNLLSNQSSRRNTVKLKGQITCVLYFTFHQMYKLPTFLLPVYDRFCL